MRYGSRHMACQCRVAQGQAGSGSGAGSPHNSVAAEVRAVAAQQIVPVRPDLRGNHRRQSANVLRISDRDGVEARSGGCSYTLTRLQHLVELPTPCDGHKVTILKAAAVRDCCQRKDGEQHQNHFAQSSVHLKARLRPRHVCQLPHCSVAGHLGSR